MSVHLNEHDHVWVEHLPVTVGARPVYTCTCGQYRTQPIPPSYIEVQVATREGFMRGFRQATASTVGPWARAGWTGCDCDAIDGDHSSRCAIYVPPDHKDECPWKDCEMACTCSEAVE